MKRFALKRNLKANGYLVTCQITRNPSDFNIQDEDSDGDDSEWDDDLVMKREDPEEVKKEHMNWLDENCGDIQEEHKFIVFESKMKELFARYVRCPNCTGSKTYNKRVCSNN